MTQQLVNQNFKNKFNQSNEVGTKGQNLFLAHMNEKHPSIKVIDVSLDPAYQYQDIDYIFVYPDGTEVTVELKTDTNDWSPNFAIETVANQETNRKGWIFTSTSTILAYYYINGLKGGVPNLYFLDMAEMRENVLRNKYMERPAKPEQQLRNTGTKTTIVTLVPRNRANILKAWHAPISATENPHSAAYDYRRKS